MISEQNKVNFYQSQAQMVSDRITKLKAQSRRLMIGNIASFMAALGCIILLTLNSSTDIVKLSDKAFEFVIFMMVFGIFGTMVFANIMKGRFKFRAARIACIILSGMLSVMSKIEM